MRALGLQKLRITNGPKSLHAQGEHTARMGGMGMGGRGIGMGIGIGRLPMDPEGINLAKLLVWPPVPRPSPFVGSLRQLGCGERCFCPLGCHRIQRVWSISGRLTPPLRSTRVLATPHATSPATGITVWQDSLQPCPNVLVTTYISGADTS